MKKNVKVSLITDEFVEAFETYKLKYSYYAIEFDFNINDKMKEINISIFSDREYKDIFKIFLLIYELLFINYGYFFEIDSYMENDKKIDINRYFNLDYIHSSKILKTTGSVTTLPNLITNNTIKEYKKIKNVFHNGVSALFYLKSYKYDGLLIDHRFCMLSQICEGYIESGRLENIIKSKKNGKIGFKDRLTYYVDKLDFYNKKYNLCIYKTLTIKRKTLLEQIETSRHALSHYVQIKDKKGNNKSKLNNYNFLFTYLILEYMLRIILLEELGVKINEKQLRENLFILHDYIYSTSNKDKLDISKYKSDLYKLLNIRLEE